MNIYHEIAKAKKAMPIGTHLILHERADPKAVRMDGESLGQVYVETARRFNTALAFPLMDLQIEKEYLLTMLGIAPEKIDRFHFEEEGPDEQQEETLRKQLKRPTLTPRMLVGKQALSVVAQEEDLLPIGMCIGPFSLLTKLLPDPITLLYVAADADEDEEEFQAVRKTLELATEVVLRWIHHQIEAGAKAICVCEPACNSVYLSPRQMETNPAILEQFVIQYNRRLKDLMSENGVDLIFHDCGELTPQMIKAFGEELKPQVLSLGSSVDLAEAASLVSKEIVLFGNLPSKKFYSDHEYSDDQVKTDVTTLRRRMDESGHPYILGSECDVLCVEGREDVIRRKVDVMIQS